MRNLVLSSANVFKATSANFIAIANDLDQDVEYITSEIVDEEESEVAVEVWKSDEQNSASVFTMFTSKYVSSVVPQVVSTHVIPDNRQLCIIMRSGDIFMMPLDEECPIPEGEGTVEPGISAASWCPDDSLLVIITSDRKVILMTSAFDVLTEGPLSPEEFGEDAPVNVGWGSKKTQFHGSLGKAAAQAPIPSSVNVGCSPDDDHLPRISWRGDGSYFCVSSSSNHRVLRVFSREGVLQATSEAVAGLEHPLHWRPSGNLIASTQRFGSAPGLGPGKEGRHDVVFFERNGLRHGEFTLHHLHLQGQYRVKDLRWSSDSTVLAVWIDRKELGDIVQLWTTGNYHWYFKQEVAAPTNTHFTSLDFHVEKTLQLVLTTPNSVIHYSYSWDTATSSNETIPNDAGLVAVIDGPNILLTPFRRQNVPPPMSSHQILLGPPRLPSSIAFSTPATSDCLVVLCTSGEADVYKLNTRMEGRGKVIEPKLLFSFTALSKEDAIMYRQTIMHNHDSLNIVSILGSSYDGGNDTLTIYHLSDIGETIAKHFVDLPGSNGKLLRGGSDGELVWQNFKGGLFEVLYEPDVTVIQVSTFPEFCWNVLMDTSVSETIYVGQSASGKLYISKKNSAPRLLISNATSFTIASGFLIYTSTTHEATFASLQSLLNLPSDSLPTWETRRIERGSKIVVAVPSNMSLVLQMPRGNLETINPRPLVMSVVKADLDSHNYRKAFISCRKHRIDLNVLVDHDRTAFLARLGEFIEQVSEVDFINLFLTSIGRAEGKSPAGIAEVCDAVRTKLEGKDRMVYVNSILTAHVVKTPPDYEAGLRHLLTLRDTHPELVEDAVKYIIFLVDANKLFDTALGMYDFAIVLMIAQHAQKDPREYLPFLRELRTLEKYYQRFRIDDHLKRYESALKNLSLADSTHFDEATDYIESHQLYESALSIWKDTPLYNDVLVIYGDWLFERREFRQAAVVFVKAENVPKALVAYEKSLDWQDLFDLAIRHGIEEEELVEMGYRVAEDLSSKKRYIESARVLLDYVHDVRECISTLVQGNEFSEARRLITLHHVPELLEELVYPGTLDARMQISEDLSEMSTQLRKQLGRLKELRVKKVEEPDAFYGEEDIALHNVDVMTDVSMPFTAFTRYTAAPSTATSRKTKVSSRSKRKAERKIGSGRKGTVDEEEYLVKSVGKLAVRYGNTKRDAAMLLPHLSQFTDEHRREALQLQKEVSEFDQELQEAVEWVWAKKPDIEDGEELQDTWRERMAELEKKRLINPVDKIDKPALDEHRDWKVKLLELL